MDLRIKIFNYIGDRNPVYICGQCNSANTEINRDTAGSRKATQDDGKEKLMKEFKEMLNEAMDKALNETVKEIRSDRKMWKYFLPSGTSILALIISVVALVIALK